MRSAILGGGLESLSLWLAQLHGMVRWRSDLVLVDLLRRSQLAPLTRRGWRRLQRRTREKLRWLAVGGSHVTGARTRLAFCPPTPGGS